MKPASTQQELEITAEDFVARVDDQLQSQYRLDTQLLFARDYARAAREAGYTPSECVTWLAKINGLE